jgi:diaminopimelate epimerase
MAIMRLFNSDGSGAEVSGNGLRCFAQAIAMRRGTTTLEVDVETLAGVRACVVQPTGDPAICTASVDMGNVTAGDKPDADDFLASIDLTVRRWALGAVGNPHVVIEVPDPAAVDRPLVGPAIESHFPNGVNAHFVRIAANDTVELWPWERGAGATQACGSGATVAAQRAHEWGAVGERVTIVMPGGTATVDVATGERGSAILSGEATFVAAVQVPHG